MRFSAKLFRLFFSSLWLAVFSTATGNLHLRVERSGVTGSGLAVTGLTDDFDQQSRPTGMGIDIGADQYSPTVPDKNPSGPNSRTTLSWLLLLTGSSP